MGGSKSSSGADEGERRIAKDGKAYTRAEFIQHYRADADREWQNANTEEKRVAKEGKAYTREEFRTFSGSTSESQWEDARPAASSGASGSDGVTISGNVVQTCTTQFVGCLRVSYRKSGATQVSHMAAAGLEPRLTKAWTAPSSWMCSSSSSSSRVDLFSEGRVSADGLIDAQESANTAGTWAIRVVCFILVIVGVYAFLQPIQAIADMIDRTLDLFKFIPAFAVMSISWLFMRPLLGIPAVILCALIFGFTVNAMRAYANEGKEKRLKNA